MQFSGLYSSPMSLPNSEEYFSFLPAPNPLTGIRLRLSKSFACLLWSALSASPSVVSVLLIPLKNPWRDRKKKKRLSEIKQILYSPFTVTPTHLIIPDNTTSFLNYKTHCKETTEQWKIGHSSVSQVSVCVLTAYFLQARDTEILGKGILLQTYKNQWYTIALKKFQTILGQLDTFMRGELL